MHVFFLFSPPQIDAVARDRYIAPSETLVVEDTRAWQHASDGLGRSKLAEKLHKVVLGTQMTGRNLTTLTALVALLDRPAETG